MKRIWIQASLVGIALLALLGLSACDQSGSSDEAAKQNQDDVTLDIRPKSDFLEIQWTDLMPKADLEALMTPPAYVTEVADGSFEDVIGNEFPDMATATGGDLYQQALVSTVIKEEMDGRPVRLAGFVVPLEFDDDLVVTQFFLVPYFGACIHVPPPPPNQIIFVDYPAGLTQKALDDPFWLYGVLKTSLTQSDIGTSAYSLDLHYFEPYMEE